MVSASFEKDLYYGMLGNSQVKELQEFLTDQGLYSGPITGNFFSLTLSAVKKFQTAKSISPQFGYFGPLSRRKANAAISVKAALEIAHQKSSTPTQVLPSNPDLKYAPIYGIAGIFFP